MSSLKRPRVDAVGESCYSARISFFRFEDLRIEESPRLISLWIDKAFWTKDAERGHIDGVVFKNIRATANPVRVELKGFDETHAVENVRFDDVVVNGKALAADENQRVCEECNLALMGSIRCSRTFL